MKNPLEKLIHKDKLIFQKIQKNRLKIEKQDNGGSAWKV